MSLPAGEVFFVFYEIPAGNSLYKWHGEMVYYGAGSMIPALGRIILTKQKAVISFRMRRGAFWVCAGENVPGSHTRQGASAEDTKAASVRNEPASRLNHSFICDNQS